MKTVQSIVWVGRSVRRELSQEIGATLQRVRMNFNHKNSWCTLAFVSIEAATTTSPLFYHISLDIIQNTLPRFSFTKPGEIQTGDFLVALKYWPDEHECKSMFSSH